MGWARLLRFARGVHQNDVQLVGNAAAVNAQLDGIACLTLVFDRVEIVHRGNACAIEGGDDIAGLQAAGTFCRFAGRTGRAAVS